MKEIFLSSYRGIQMRTPAKFGFVGVKSTLIMTSKFVVYSAKHIPSGEEWLLLGIDVKGNRVCAAGWPQTIGKLSDCADIKKLRPMTVEEYKHRCTYFGMSWDEIGPEHPAQVLEKC